MELPADIYRKVTRLSELGNQHADHGEWDFAITEWQKALALLPAPAEQWDAASWLNASIGDAHWQAGRGDATRIAMQAALKCSGATDNPFIWFRLGQANLKLRDEEGATQNLLKAYMLAGKEIFDDDPDGAAALAFLNGRVKL